MDLTTDETPAAKPKNRKLIYIVGGMTILAMLALIALVLFSSFPGPPQGSSDKTQAPEEDVSKARP
jgi:flagellar basal body-associated protein FliL